MTAEFPSSWLALNITLLRYTLTHLSTPKLLLPTQLPYVVMISYKHIDLYTLSVSYNDLILMQEAP